MRENFSMKKNHNTTAIIMNLSLMEIGVFSLMETT